jgi:hypothetical protein
MTRHVPARRVEDDAGPTLAGRIGSAVLDLVAGVPKSEEGRSRGPDERARAIAAAAANRAAIAAGTLALPPGALGWLTIVPELVAIWRIQAQMVADIAAAYGVGAQLTRERMLYCLFKHAAAQAMRDLVVQVGGRLLVQDVPLRVIERVAAKIGIQVSRRLVGRGIARWLPVVGALGVGAYAYYDTGQVARTAIALFGAPPAPDTAAAHQPVRRGIRRRTGEGAAAR